ncbi:hypothetical protein C8A00DRAFT_30474 [Chaetomidium leptoderma]|uniref:Uncharacterized protein n=1 Tax=Chaetomidium leptoderma TaxID=669021 RepID=A0AAN7A1A4_9PEZI|nr:hypothetical protein C8A00DRAFT_30474 [Chaetomidium leptoderma]
MATTIVQTPSPPDQEGTTAVVLSGEASLCRDHLQEDWGYAAGHHALAQPPHAQGDIGEWQGGLPLPSYYEYNTTLTGTIWPNYGTAPADTTWHPTVNHDSPSFGPYGSVWPASPAESLSNHPWSPSDQPLPSPLSDLGGPSYFFLARNPLGEDGLHAGQAIAPIIASRDAAAASLHNSPATTTINSITPTPLLKTKDSKSNNKKAAPASKRPAAEATPHPPRPRTLKRHKSDAPSVTSISTDRTSASTSTAATTTTTTLGGVLPANVDPRVASEQIKREAWERCKAEAFEMSQRRMMLLNHEHGALEREAQRLQVNLGLMREAVARDEAAAGLEEEEKEAAAAADGAGMWVAGSG